MKKTELKNWLAALGIGSGFAFNAGLAETPPADLQARARAELAVVGMTGSAPETGQVYVVINHEEQYSIWPREMEIPEGWRRLGRELSLERAGMQLQRRATSMRFRVVINHEEQYSIWPVEYELPRGFEPIGEVCEVAECVKRIEG